MWAACFLRCRSWYVAYLWWQYGPKCLASGTVLGSSFLFIFDSSLAFVSKLTPPLPCFRPSDSAGGTALTCERTLPWKCPQALGPFLIRWTRFSSLLAAVALPSLPARHPSHNLLQVSAKALGTNPSPVKFPTEDLICTSPSGWPPLFAVLGRSRLPIVACLFFCASASNQVAVTVSCGYRTCSSLSFPQELPTSTPLLRCASSGGRPVDNIRAMTRKRKALVFVALNSRGLLLRVLQVVGSSTSGARNAAKSRAGPNSFERKLFQLTWQTFSRY